MFGVLTRLGGVGRIGISLIEWAASHVRSPTFVPVNYQRADATRLALDRDSALGIVSSYQKWLPRCGLVPDGCAIVELGPGPAFGAQLILASMGARVTVADRFLAKWDSDYHPALYAAIAERWPGPRGQIDAVVAGNRHEASTLRLLEEPAENLRSIPDAGIDFMYSHTVLEHVVDIASVAGEMARIIKPGGWAMHQIDLRDHRDFARPLEHLVMGERAFAAAAAAAHYEFGNRLRSLELEAQFEANGFELREIETTETASPEYMSDALPRLRRSASRYRHWPEEDLTCLGIACLLQKREGSQRQAVQSRGRRTLALVDALKSLP
jgi:SAM-dependent methyltransferase